MLQYLIILLDDTSTSYCHYENTISQRNLIPIQTLRNGILYGMKENLIIQFVYPDYELPQKYKDIIETIDHKKIVSTLCEDTVLKAKADVVVFHEWTRLDYYTLDMDKVYALRTSKADFFYHYQFLKNVLGKVKRLNIILTDIDKFTVEDISKYKQAMAYLVNDLVELFKKGQIPQLNILTDRLMLNMMNNCNAGWESITLAPNGKFYVCPAFYCDNDFSIGSLVEGLDIKNPQLYRLDHAPICRHCDAFQCHRCIWLNKKLTLEVNTPSHEQCVVAHIERNASRDILNKSCNLGDFLPNKEIPEINFLDPFDKKEDW